MKDMLDKIIQIEKKYIELGKIKNYIKKNFKEIAN